MKLSNIIFISKAYIKGSKSSIKLAIALLVIAVTVVSSFVAVITNNMNESTKLFRARALYLSPWKKPVTEQALKEIASLDHVQYIDDATALYGANSFEIVDTNDAEYNIEKEKHKGTYIFVDGLYEHEKKKVVYGNNLDDSEEFSCIVPSLFYPFEDNDDNFDYKNLNYIDGKQLVGKTVTIKGYNGSFSFPYNVSADNSESFSVDGDVKSPEFNLKVVGTYYCSRASSGGFDTIYVSKETSKKMTKSAIENSDIDLSGNKNEIAKWWNTPSLHSYVVVADDHNNLNSVYNSVSQLGYDIASDAEWHIESSTVLLSNIFRIIGYLLIISIVIVSIITVMQSSVTEIKNRKGFIGLLKAIGYKNKQIFACLCFEQAYRILSSFLAGFAISALVVGISNYVFKHGPYVLMIYMIDWKMFFAFLLVSLTLVIIIPLICQCVVLYKLKKIQPYEALK